LGSAYNDSKKLDVTFGMDIFTGYLVISTVLVIFQFIAEKVFHAPDVSPLLRLMPWFVDPFYS